MSQKNAQEAIYQKIVDQLETVDGINNGPMRAQMVRDLAVAYRAVLGGQQPGGSAPSK